MTLTNNVNNTVFFILPVFHLVLQNRQRLQPTSFQLMHVIRIALFDVGCVENVQKHCAIK